jgi:hypothetical protein
MAEDGKVKRSGTTFQGSARMVVCKAEDPQVAVIGLFVPIFLFGV